MHSSLKIHPAVKVWLFTGIIMIYFQVVIGGITRLTGSGLSITKWDIVTGSIPPLKEDQWQQAFELYKQTPQYQKINQGMELSRFKWIYFWEYVHRLWARSMGFVFLIPFLIFWLKGYLKDRGLKTDLFIVFLLAGIVGLFGWIMVASGLVDRPWVNAYKLSLHLGLALLTLSFLWWVYLKHLNMDALPLSRQGRIWSGIFLILVSLQILLGGLMSGMKAALLYPTFPLMRGHLVDPIIFRADSWQWKHFVDYDVYPFLPALVQVFHRSLAMVILVVLIVALARMKDRSLLVIGTLLSVQIVLGILTLIYSIGMIPVVYGVLHQAVGILLLLAAVRWYYGHRRSVD